MKPEELVQIVKAEIDKLEPLPQAAGIGWKVGCQYGTFWEGRHRPSYCGVQVFVEPDCDDRDPKSLRLIYERSAFTLEEHEIMAPDLRERIQRELAEIHRHLAEILERA